MFFQVPLSENYTKNLTKSSMSNDNYFNESDIFSKIDHKKLGSLLPLHINVSYQENIDNLDPYTEYEVRVAAVNSAGIGKFTFKKVLTFEDIPTTGPIDLSYKNLSSTAVNITWSVPVEANGVITRYTVGIGTPDGLKKIDTTDNYLVVENLLKYSPYQVRIGLHI